VQARLRLQNDGSVLRPEPGPVVPTRKSGRRDVVPGFRSGPRTLGEADGPPCGAGLPLVSTSHHAGSTLGNQSACLRHVSVNLVSSTH